MIRSDLLRHHHRHPPIIPFLSVYGSRRRLLRTALLGLAAGWPGIPMASAIEQSAARRMPIGAFACWKDATMRLQRLWDAIEAKLRLSDTSNFESVSTTAARGVTMESKLPTFFRTQSDWSWQELTVTGCRFHILRMSGSSWKPPFAAKPTNDTKVPFLANYGFNVFAHMIR